MSDGTNTVRLGSLCDPTRGITYGIVKVGDFVEDGVPVLRGGDIRDGRLKFDENKRVSREVSNQFRRTVLRGGEIVINLIAEPGHCAIVPETFAGFNVTRDVAVIPLNESVDHQFINFYLKSPQCISWLTSRLQGSVTQKINLSTLNELPVPVLPLEKQRVIARILGDLEAKIDLNRRMNETLEAIARALFRSWFVDFDPVRAKQEGRQPPGLDAATAALFPNSFEDSPLGPIPKGWFARAVYDCARYTNGTAFRNEQFSRERRGLPVIKIAELKDGITGQTKFTEDVLQDKYRVRCGDLLFSWSGSPDTSIDTFLWAGRDGWLNQHVFKVETDRTEARLFVYFLLRQLKPTFIEIARNKQTTGLGHVTAQDMKALRAVVPEYQVLLAFSRVVSPLYDRAFLA
jgi:type I restriction enzyme S subunit